MINYQSQMFYPPVCIADLPGYDFAVTPRTLTKEVMSAFKKQSMLPGAMVMEDGRLLGVISRLKLFERLNHHLGAESFLSKPISQFKDTMHSRVQAMPGNLSVSEAVHYAFSRPVLDIYDPIAIIGRNEQPILIDMDLLLLVQAHATASLSNLSSSLEQIDYLIGSDWNQSELLNEIIMDLRQVVPYHQAAILLVDGTKTKAAAQAGYPQSLIPDGSILTSTIYEILLKHRHTIHVQNTSSVPVWKGMESLGAPVTWFGSPIFLENRLAGILSISRDVDRAFSNDEREIALKFVQRIMKTLARDRAAHEQAFTLKPKMKHKQTLPKHFPMKVLPSVVNAGQ